MKTKSSHDRAQIPSSRTWRRAIPAAMMKATPSLLFVAFAIAPPDIQAAETTGEVAVSAHDFSVSSSYISLTNPFPNSVSMYELHFGYRLTPKDIVAIKVCTWKLFEPMGIPLWDPHLQKRSEFYPGKIHELGIGLSYQRFLWEGLFASIQVVPLKKRYLDEKGKKIDDGFKLYTSYHLGYHWAFYRNRFFVEPQIHFNYWPIDSKGPVGFENKEAKWTNNYFLFEPNLFFGVNL